MNPDPGAREGRHREREIYTVSMLNQQARELVEEHFAQVWVEGEISNLARPRSGHLYFSLKDPHAQIRCAMFRMHNRNLNFEPADGMQVVAWAKASIYPERGEFQLRVQSLEEAGAGALKRAYEALKQRLAVEGLFDEDRKRRLPEFPRCVGVITSPSGAAVRDIVSVIRRRYPLASVLIHPVAVQGPTAAPGIADALDRASASQNCDVLILARGGGSLEDLWAFNEETVARAIARCTVPVVTGVGHEVDFTIADFVADQRAATPSAAAELVTPDGSAWPSRLRTLERRLELRMSERLRQETHNLRWLRSRLARPERQLQDHQQRVDGLMMRGANAMMARLERKHTHLRELVKRLERKDPSLVLQYRQASLREVKARLLRAVRHLHAVRARRLEGLSRALLALGPAQTLERGYAIVTRGVDGALVSDPDQVTRGEALTVRVAKGYVRSRVTGVGPEPEGDPQGDLF